MRQRLEKMTNLFTLIVVILTAFQGLIPTIPVQSPHTVTLLSAIAMFLVSGFTALKQWASNEINNGALTPTLIVTIIAILGGVNDIIDIVHMSETVDQWVRFGLTFVVMSLSLASKILWPTIETKSSI